MYGGVRYCLSARNCDCSCVCACNVCVCVCLWGVGVGPEVHLNNTLVSPRRHSALRCCSFFTLSLSPRIRCGARTHLLPLDSRHVWVQRGKELLKLKRVQKTVAVVVEASEHLVHLVRLRTAV